MFTFWQMAYIVIESKNYIIVSKEMIITKNLVIESCHDCPFFKLNEDTSVCYDSFDDPNYDWYCQHKDSDNSGLESSKYNDEKYGKFIGGSFSRFAKCSIPEWCPLEDHQLS